MKANNRLTAEGIDLVGKQLKDPPLFNQVLRRVNIRRTDPKTPARCLPSLRHAPRGAKSAAADFRCSADYLEVG